MLLQLCLHTCVHTPVFCTRVFHDCVFHGLHRYTVACRTASLVTSHCLSHRPVRHFPFDLYYPLSAAFLPAERGIRRFFRSRMTFRNRPRNSPSLHLQFTHSPESIHFACLTSALAAEQSRPSNGIRPAQGEGPFPPGFHRTGVPPLAGASGIGIREERSTDQCIPITLSGARSWPDSPLFSPVPPFWAPCPWLRPPKPPTCRR